jgi:hypothetical protein
MLIDTVAQSNCYFGHEWAWLTKVLTKDSHLRFDAVNALAFSQPVFGERPVARDCPQGRLLKSAPKPDRLGWRGRAHGSETVLTEQKTTPA